MNKIIVKGKKVYYSKFNNESLAISASDRMAKTWIVLGDNGEYWLTTPKNAAILEKAGYQIFS